MTVVIKDPEQKALPKLADFDSISGGVRRMLIAIWPAVRSGAVGAIVGEDTCGRIPALIAAGVINRWNRRHGRPPLPLIFAEGAEDAGMDAAAGAAFAARLPLLRGVDRSKRVLVLTDRVRTGHSVASIGRQLTEAGFGWDVAAIDGCDLTPRTAADDRARIDSAHKQWESEQAGLKRQHAQFTAKLASLETRSAAETERLRTGLINAADQREGELQAELDALVAEGPPQGWWLKDRKTRAYDAHTAELRQGIDAYRNRTEPADLRLALDTHTSQTAQRIAQFRTQIAATERRFQPHFDPATVIGDDARAVWPDDTRLFAGGLRLRAGALGTMSGLSDQKFATSRVLTDAKQRAYAHTIRRAIAAAIPNHLADLEYQGTFTRKKILPWAAYVAGQIRTDIRRDRYAVIFGDDTSGRFFTLLIGLGINGYRKRHGQKSLPMFFIEGIQQKDWKPQIRAFKKFEPALAALDHNKRALLITDRVGTGGSTGSIAWLLHKAGFEVDILTMSGLEYSVKSQIGDGTWPPGTRAFPGNLSGDNPLIDNITANGLRQRTGDNGDEKFSNKSLRLRKGQYRNEVVTNRRDAHVAASRIADQIGGGRLAVDEIEKILPVMADVARNLQPALTKDEYRAVVGEDTGGRIPALIIGRAINTARRSRGRQRLPVLFMPGGADDPSAFDQRYAHVLPALKGGRVLLFSGPLHSGKTTGPIAWWLHNNGAGVDIVAPRAADKPIAEYIASGQLPPHTRLLDVYHDTEKSLGLLKKSDVTGVATGEDHCVRAVRGQTRADVPLARRNIAHGLASVVKCL